jgi:uncharacterized membrane protein YkvA (DUF1232 family)
MAADAQSGFRLPVPAVQDERIVRRGFWRKLHRVAGQIPFAEDAAAAYFCTLDRTTPPKVKAILLAALAYFVMPFDLIPDVLAGIGFVDDAAVLALALGAVSGAIKESHRARARAVLGA